MPDVLGQVQTLMGKPRAMGLVLSGGEPLLYHADTQLQTLLCAGVFSWQAIETSGYAGVRGLYSREVQSFLTMFDTLCLSPKITPCLHGRQSDAELEKNIPLFMATADKATSLHFKFVVRDEADVDAVLDCNDRHNFIGKFPTYLMPYGNDRDEILRSIEWLVPVAQQHGFIITPRLQALLWGKTRAK